jgi:hypothetical protein
MLNIICTLGIFTKFEGQLYFFKSNFHPHIIVEQINTIPITINSEPFRRTFRVRSPLTVQDWTMPRD